MKSFIKEIVESKISNLKLVYEANKNVQHQGIKGDFNETLLCELIQDIIPTKYKLTNGFIQDKNAKQSNESDIVIYDNEILPAILIKEDLGVIPAESVEYVFEVKSTLNATELKTTIEKFNNLHTLSGFRKRTVLFAFSSDLNKKLEIERFYENEKETFFKSPSIRVLNVLNRGYYFFSIEKRYMKEYFDKNTFAKMCYHSGADFNIDNTNLKINAEDVTFNIEKDLIINDINYESLYINIYRWYGVESKDDNCGFLNFLSGVSNTLCKEPFGSYLLSNCNVDIKLYSDCIVDMWGNTSIQEFFSEGVNPEKSQYSFRFTFENEGSNRIMAKGHYNNIS